MNLKKIYVKTFNGLGNNLDSEINGWLSTNDVEVVDIKYTTVISQQTERIFDRAMLIYKTEIHSKEECEKDVELE